MLTKGLSREKIKKETPKVYCSNCIHFSEFSKDPVINMQRELEEINSDKCMVRLEYRDTWKERESYYKNPVYKNIGNDCRDYSELPLLPVPVCEYCKAINIHVRTTDKGTLTICNNEWCIGFLHDVTDKWMYDTMIDKFIPVPEDLKIRKI